MTPDDTDDEPENLSTVGSGGVDALFDELESTVELLDSLGDDLESIHRRIDANEGAVSGHVRNRINDDADQLSRDAERATVKIREELDALKRRV